MPKDSEKAIGLESSVRVSFLLATLPIIVGMIVLIIQNHQIQAKMDSGWTAPNMAVWAKDFQQSNPQLKVPDPLAIKRMMDGGTAALFDPITTVQMTP